MDFNPLPGGKHRGIQNGSWARVGFINRLAGAMWIPSERKILPNSKRNFSDHVTPLHDKNCISKIFIRSCNFLGGLILAQIDQNLGMNIRTWKAIHDLNHSRNDFGADGRLLFLRGGGERFHFHPGRQTWPSWKRGRGPEGERRAECAKNYQVIDWLECKIVAQMISGDDFLSFMMGVSIRTSPDILDAQESKTGRPLEGLMWLS